MILKFVWNHKKAQIAKAVKVKEVKERQNKKWKEMKDKQSWRQASHFLVLN